MKKIILITTLILLGITQAEAQKKIPVQLAGSVKNVSSGKIYLQQFNNKMFSTIDSAQITNGKFRFSTPVQLPELYGLTLDTVRPTYYLFLENKPVTVQLDTANYYANTSVTGSDLQSLFIDYRKEEDVDIDAFIKQHPKSLVAAYVLYRDFSYQLNPDQIKNLVQQLDPSLQNTSYVGVLNELVKTLEGVSIGKKAPDFSAPDTNGNTTRLYDHIGKGYLLIDFWASWCPPCREENPNFVRIYQKYKDKGFDIFAVSLDKNKERWLKGISDDQLTWTHVSDLLFWNSAPAKLYGVRAIPSNFLVDSSGTIVAKNVMGEDLENLLNKLLLIKN